MSITGIILAAVIVGGTGLFIGVFLGVAGKKFSVAVDEREEAILGVLPGNNCGGCGYAGCGGLAAAIVAGEAEVGGCPVGGAPVAAQVGEIMGLDAGEQIRMTAFVKCGGTCEKAKQEYEYFGVEDCVMAGMMQDGGPKACNYGCMGYGSCVKACPFDAIHV
ncbi:MAG: (Fe-S)-binding protein, partial [Lachnospiraceae bacterium]